MSGGFPAPTFTLRNTSLPLVPRGGSTESADATPAGTVSESRARAISKCSLLIASLHSLPSSKQFRCDASGTSRRAAPLHFFTSAAAWRSARVGGVPSGFLMVKPTGLVDRQRYGRSESKSLRNSNRILTNFLHRYEWSGQALPLRALPLEPCRAPTTPRRADGALDS